jgi:hypothetical protein
VLRHGIMEAGPPTGAVRHDRCQFRVVIVASAIKIQAAHKEEVRGALRTYYGMPWITTVPIWYQSVGL